MNITGIIVEYNPFHNGHLMHIKNAIDVTKADAIIAVMSGNFVQRGSPAIIDKWNRTRMALLNGVDLVIELPVIYSLSSAEFFSYGAVSLLNSLGVVNNLCFGSECGDINKLFEIANKLSSESNEFRKIIRKQLDEGMPYPKARNIALKIAMESNCNLKTEINDILSSPNNILGIEYCKSIIRLNSNIKAFTIKRQGSGYNCDLLEGKYASATGIRKYLYKNEDLVEIKEYIPESVYNDIIELNRNNYDFVYKDKIFQYVKYKILTGKGSEEIKMLPDVSEGLHNRIYSSIKNVHNYSDFMNLVKTKRYTYTRISRILCQYFIGFEQYDTKNLRNIPCPYVRVLGFNKKGIEVLKYAKNKASIPIINKMPKHLDETLSLELHATKAYSLLNSSINPDSDYTISPLYFK